MKKSYLLVLCIICFLIIINCNTNTDPLEEIENDVYLHIDSTKVYIKEGIFIELYSLESNYSLDDTIKGDLYLINENNNEGLEIFIGSWPPAGGYRILNEQNESLYFNVWAIGCAEFHHNLMPGDTLKEPIQWTQRISINPDYYSGLKLFSGYYKLQGMFWGNDTLRHKYATKWFEITEDGEPLSTKAHRHYEIEDSIKVSFIIRNRVSLGKTYEINAQKRIEIHYIKDEETKLVQYDYLDIPDLRINFDPKSDNTIYTYSIAEDDSVLSGLDGRYDLTFILRCEERNIQASVATYIF